MSETQLVQAAVENDADDEHDEFKALWTDARDGVDRFEALASNAEKAGQTEIAKVYREVKETVLGLLVDLTASTGGAILTLQDDLEEIESESGGEIDESVLLPDDAAKYIELFEQYIKLLDGLTSLVPPGSEGDKQREVFATLRRMTEGMLDFTRNITAVEESEEPGNGPEKDE